MRHYSCQQIRSGFNFYRSGKITACCHKIDPELEIANLADPDLPSRILEGQMRIMIRHRQGDPPSICKRCVNFVERDWQDDFRGGFTRLIFNHFKKCNLSCAHCGYRSQDSKESDTPHEAVFDAVKSVIASKICSPEPLLEIGGGEPSLAAGLERMLDYGLAHQWSALINSNGARFSELFARGVNAGNFTLLLTPDAGSREVYARIKGVDSFGATWRNIGRYMAATDGKALVKFILENGNHHDIPAMIDTSKKYGVKTVVLSMDMNIDKDLHPFYIGKAKEFIRLAKRAELKVLKGAFLPLF